MTSAIWFRVDLRLAENPAFYHAIKSSLNSKTQKPVLAIYIISPQDWTRHDVAAVKVDFILRNLKLLSASLSSQYGIPLLVQKVEKASEVPSAVLELCETHKINELFFNQEYEVNEGRRDQRVAELLTAKNIKTHVYHDQAIVPPNTLRSKSANTVYAMYSPFKKAWYAEVFSKRDQYLKSFNLNELSSFVKQTIELKPSEIPDSIKGFELSEQKQAVLRNLYPAGEVEAVRRLHDFADSKRIANYKKDRDFPELNGGTSVLSPYLASGVISVKQCFLKALSLNGGKMDTGNEGIVCWIQELIWRDFYKSILAGFPRVCMNKPFKADTADVPWRYDEKELKAWCEGKTGYPIVDAGMRQLNETGWMHNRVRMIVASFLTKHLLHHWMEGEKYFMKQLIDGDFSANNGGWQWAASTGTDSQPYFRVFNPHLQSKKFDPKGVYIKKWVPELRAVNDVEALHNPDSINVSKIGYYPKIVQHEFGRARAIEAFKTKTLLTAPKPAEKRKRDADDD